MAEATYTTLAACPHCRGAHDSQVTCIGHWRSEAGRLEVEAEKIADVVAHMAAAITGSLKPHVAYVGKPFRSIEEALVLRRAADRLAEEVIRLRRPLHLRMTVDITEEDVTEEILRQVKAAEKELPS
jgi:predicted aconitase